MRRAAAATVLAVLALLVGCGPATGTGGDELTRIEHELDAIGRDLDAG